MVWVCCTSRVLDQDMRKTWTVERARYPLDLEGISKQLQFVHSDTAQV